MVFIHDTQLSLAAAVELVNTLPETRSEGVDTLTTVADLRRFLSGQPYSGRVRRDAEESPDGRLSQLAVDFASALLDGSLPPRESGEWIRRNVCA